MSTNRIQVTDLDFDEIKNNLKNFLKSQSEFSDYDFEGSGLNVLLDILAYNTHYNAYYLNMVANEAFLDTAILRNSVVSHAKTLGYTSKSSTSPVAVIDLTIPTASNTADSLTLPRGFSFKSELIDNVSYNFVVLEDITIEKTGNNFVYLDLPIHEGQLVSYNYVYNKLSNPKAIFALPDTNVDTTSLVVSIQNSTSNLSSKIYTQATDILNVDLNSEVYFLQEGLDEQYQIYFGNGVIGKELSDGSVVNINYLVTSGSEANKANNFVVNSVVETFTNYTVNPIAEASGGASKEISSSIKENAILQYSTQNRLVTTNDYDSYLRKNYPALQSISVWGGEDENPPIFGKVFISIKPKDNYYITELEKQRIIEEILKPKSMISVRSEIRDPEYLYLKVENKVRYDRRKTSYNDEQLRNLIKSAIYSYSDTNLNTFGSTFVLSKLQDSIDGVDLNAIVGSESILRLEKRLNPELGQTKTYDIAFNAPLHRGTIINRLISSEFQITDNFGVLRNAIIEEVPESYTGLSSISVIDPGYGYTTTPTVTITGDGYGAIAEAVIVNGRIQNIEIINRGINYTRAVISISGGNGFGGSALAILDSKFGSLRTIYFNSEAERQIINSNAGTIDYINGLVTLRNIRILAVNTFDNLLRINVESENGILTSNKNTVLTIDQSDSTSVSTTFITA
jgi:hypothetical protein